MHGGALLSPSCPQPTPRHQTAATLVPSRTCECVTRGADGVLGRALDGTLRGTPGDHVGGVVHHLLQLDAALGRRVLLQKRALQLQAQYVPLRRRPRSACGSLASRAGHGGGGLHHARPRPSDLPVRTTTDCGRHGRRDFSDATAAGGQGGSALRPRHRRTTPFAGVTVLWRPPSPRPHTATQHVRGGIQPRAAQLHEPAVHRRIARCQANQSRPRLVTPRTLPRRQRDGTGTVHERIQDAAEAHGCRPKPERSWLQVRRGAQLRQRGDQGSAPTTALTGFVG